MSLSIFGPQQVSRSLAWTTAPSVPPPVGQTSAHALQDILFALQERYEGAVLTPPALSIQAYTGNDYSELLTQLSQAATQADRDPLVQQIHTAILGLAGRYVTPSCDTILAPALLALGVKASGADWTDLPAARAGLRLLQYRAQTVRTVDSSFTVDLLPNGYRYASWLLPRQVGPARVVGYRLVSFTSAIGGLAAVEDFASLAPMLTFRHSG